MDTQTQETTGARAGVEPLSFRSTKEILETRLAFLAQYGKRMDRLAWLGYMLVMAGCAALIYAQGEFGSLSGSGFLLPFIVVLGPGIALSRSCQQRAIRAWERQCELEEVLVSLESMRESGQARQFIWPRLEKKIFRPLNQPEPVEQEQGVLPFFEWVGKARKAISGEASPRDVASAENRLKGEVQGREGRRK